MEPRPPDVWADRIRPFLAGLSSAAVVMLAFLVPSIQDLWDRHQTRGAVDRYEQIGRALLAREKFTAAEEAFDRALELGGNQRYDLLELKLRARVLRIHEDPDWAGRVPEDLREGDFLYLIELERAPGREKDRAIAMTAYALLLVNQKRWRDAEENLREALKLDPALGDAHVTLGNLLGDRGRFAEAEAAYRQALALDAGDASASYNLGLLFTETGRPTEAVAQFRDYVTRHPDDPHGQLRLGDALLASAQPEPARQAFEQARKLDPGNREARAALEQMPRARP